MLTTNEYLNIEDYVFKSSPESCSGNSCFTDYTDLPSDEDFLQQLSSDLDIPLLLNPGEDEMSLLSSFFDKSPEEIMSEIALSPSPNFDENAENCVEIEHPKQPPDLHSEIKIETDSCSSSSSNKSHSPIQSPNDGIKFFEIKDEVKHEPHSPEAIPTVHSSEIDSNILISTIANNQIRIVSPITTQAKKVPIPKITCSNQKNNIFKTADKRTATAIGANVLTSPPQKVVVLENITAVPVTNIAQIPSTTINNSVINTCTVPPPVILKGNDNISVNNIDPKILKRHQRRIKNRESACLSRKKKKDYLTSLEIQVKDLSEENQKLKFENKQLKERLMKYEGKPVQKGSSNVKNNIVLCMFLFSVAFHLDYVRNPFFAKNSADLMESNKPKVLDHHGRNLLWAPEETIEKNGSNFLPFSMCPVSVNQTESARLALELERWIGLPKESYNKTQPANVTGVSTSRIKSLRKRKQKKYHTTILSSVYDNHSVGKKLASGGSNKEIQVFSPTAEQLYSEFFEAINRQDDTFYVVSFSDHHMLLPALHHNKTRRPKMSLIMPSVLPNENITHPTLVPLMQIDCEVLDTRLIQIRYGSIPQHLRRNGNFSTYQNSDSVSKPSEPSTNYTTRKAYKPYFIKQKAVRSNEDREFYNIR